MSQLFRFGDLENILGSDDNGNIFRGTFEGKPVAVKKLNCTNTSEDAQRWKQLVELRYEHLVPYYQCPLQDNVRYLIMELCQGSMIDYCRKTLDQIIASNVKATDVMWQITCAVDYLHRQKIDGGKLKLQNVLFWKRDSKSRRVVVKLTGYGCKYGHSEDNIDIIRQLGSLFFSAATKNEAKPNGPIALDSLTEIPVDHRAIALDFISFLINQSLPNNFEVVAVLRHPLFTRYLEEMFSLAYVTIASPSHRFYQLIQRAPNLFALYLFHHLLDITNNQYKQVNSELEWSNLYFDDEEVVDQLWNIKYSENYENSPETIEEIIATVGKCNISERVWSSLLDRIGIHKGAALLYRAVQSRASNAPKIIEMISQRYEIIEKMETIIHWTASNKGDWGADILKIVLKHGGSPNATAPDGRTAVHFAATNESRSGPKMMKLLLENGGDPNAQSNPNVLTPIHLAAFNQGDYAAAILKLLIDNGGACDASVKSGNNIWEPIHFATMNIGKSATEIVDLLLKKRDINLVNNILGGLTLLHLAVYNSGDCGSKITTKLIENGINPNIGDNMKRTPLHCAATNEEYQNIATTKILLENGADPNLADEDGVTTAPPFTMQQLVKVKWHLIS